jgi:hypothetical protein
MTFSFSFYAQSERIAKPYEFQLRARSAALIDGFTEEDESSN